MTQIILARLPCTDSLCIARMRARIDSLTEQWFTSNPKQCNGVSGVWLPAGAISPAVNNRVIVFSYLPGDRDVNAGVKLEEAKNLMPAQIVNAM